MKKIKKLIIALILGLFAFIPLLFVKEDVKADSNINDYVVIADFEVIEDDTISQYYYYRVNTDIYSLIDIDNYNFYGLKITYSFSSLISNLSSNYTTFSYFSSIRKYNSDDALYFVINYNYYNSNGGLQNTYTNYSIVDNRNSSTFGFSGLQKVYNLVSNFQIQLIKFPNVVYTDNDVQNAFDEGYEQAKEDVILKDSPLLNGQLMIYDYENTLLESEPIDSTYLNNDGTFKYGLIYDRVSSALSDSDDVRVDIIFSYPITPNDMLQEYLRNSTSLNINSTLSSLSWIASNGYYVERDVSNIDSNYELFDFNLVPNVQGVSITARVSDLVNFSYGVVESASDRYYNEGYQKGYYDGTLNTDRLVNNAFDDGYAEGVETGYDTGYNSGYSDGMLADYSFSEDLIGVAELPFNVIGQILNFEILGINVWGLITGVLTIVLVIWLFRKFRG